MQIDYKASPTGRKFHNSDAFVRQLMGPFGSGKSVMCVMEIFTKSLQQVPDQNGKRKTRWAVVRNTYRELQDTTLKTWRDWIPAGLGTWNESKMTHTLRFNDIEAEVLFRALDKEADIKKLLSMDLTGGWLNESREIPRAVFDAIQGRLGRYPSMRDGGASWSGLICDTNPPDEDHYIYKIFEELQPESYAIFKQPSGLSEHAENTENLPRDYYKRMAIGKTEEWIKVYVHGQYGFVLDGKVVYPEYFDNLHCQEFNFINDSVVYVGLDFGLTPAALFGQRSMIGQVRCIDELVSESMGIANFIKMLKPKMGQDFPSGTRFRFFGDPSGTRRAESDETTVFKTLLASGIPAEPTISNEYNMRREGFAAPMSRLIDGQPGFLVHPRCRMLRKGLLGGYHLRRMRIPGERYTEEPDKNIYSHICEAGQYMTLGMGEGHKLITGASSSPSQRVADSAYDPLSYIPGVASHG